MIPLINIDVSWKALVCFCGSHLFIKVLIERNHDMKHIVVARSTDGQENFRLLLHVDKTDVYLYKF